MAIAAFSDPGVIPKVLEGPPINQMIRRTQLINSVEFELKICPTCNIVRPPRSSHDRKTDRCVLKFDHFCVFIGNTVGQSNYLWFLCFVGLTSFGATYFVSFSLFHVFHLANRLEREAEHETDLAVGKAVGQAILSVVVGIYFAVMGTLVSLLFWLHCYFVSTGQTTYEFMRGAWKKRLNPFNKGLRANWMAVVRDAGVHRSQCDDAPTIETAIVPELDKTEAAAVSIHIADIPSAAGTGRVASAEFQLHIGDQVVSTTLTEKMLKKSLHKALIVPYLKHNKALAGTVKLDEVMVNGEPADVKLPALSFVKHSGCAVSVQLVP